MASSGHYGSAMLLKSLTAQLEPEAKTGNLNLATGANCEKALRHGSDAMLEIGE